MSKHIIRNFGRAVEVGEIPHILVWWVLAILWRSQHMCFLSDSREAACVHLMNIGAVAQE